MKTKVSHIHKQTAVDIYDAEETVFNGGAIYPHYEIILSGYRVNKNGDEVGEAKALGVFLMSKN